MKKIKKIAGCMILAAGLLMGCSNSDTVREEEPVITADNAGPGEFQGTATMEETTLFDEQGIRITATKLSYTGYSAELSLTFENNTQKNLSFISNSIGYNCNSINGYMIDDGYLNCDVTAGAKANDTMSFNYQAMELYGITDIAVMEIGFDIQDDDYNDIYTGPRAIQTSLYQDFDPDLDTYRDSLTSRYTQDNFAYDLHYFSEESLFEESGLVVSSAAILENQDKEQAVFLEIENQTETMAQVESADISVNGLKICSGRWSTDTISPGKTRVVNLDLSSMLDSSFREEYGLDHVAEVDVDLVFEDSDKVRLCSPATIQVKNDKVSSSLNTDGKEVYNENNVRIVMKGIFESDSEYDGNMYILMLVENTGDSDISVDEIYDSFMVNGYMMDCTMDRLELSGSRSGAMIIELWEHDLEENSLSETSDITEFEIGLEIKQGNRTLDEPKVNVEV